MTFIIKTIKIILNIIYLPFKCLKKRKQITLISRQSNDITDDFKLLVKEFNKTLSDYKIVVLCKKIDNKLLYAFHMLKQMYNISRSELIILDSYCILASTLKHKKDLIIIQMWHALGLIKKAGYAILDKDEGRNSKVSIAADMHKNYTYVFTTSENCIDSMSEVFGCKKDIIKSVPLPRIDLLKNQKLIKKQKEVIYKKYPNLKNKVNVIYAPTYRKDETKLLKEVRSLSDIFDYDKYNLIIKLHPLSKLKVENSKVYIIDDFKVNEIMSVCEYVVSDYSSIIYEAGILNKKILFYAFDLDEYKGKRDFFIDYINEIPGPLCKTSHDVITSIEKFDEKKYSKNLISTYVDLTIENYTSNMVNVIKKILNGVKI